MIEKLLKLIDSKNIAENMDLQERNEIAQMVIKGYDIDCISRKEWLDVNKRAMDIVHQSGEIAQVKNEPFKKASRVIYPLLSTAIIQLAARLIPHLVRDKKALDIAVQGEDPLEIINARAKRVSDYMNYQLLLDTKWLLNSHKLVNILAAWGICFRQVYFDTIERKTKSIILHPADVIVNNNVQSLEDFNRITVKRYYNANDIVSRVNQGFFNSDISIQDFNTKKKDKQEVTASYYGEDSIQNDPQDEQPVYEILNQYVLLDQDGDGYYEPYIAEVHKGPDMLLGLRAAFEAKDVILTQDGKKVIKIKRRLDIEDYHCIDDPDGGYYSIGINHLLVNHTESCTTVLRSLLDAGTLSNYQGGFITQAIQPQDGKRIQFTELGEFKTVKVVPPVDLQKNIMPLPYKEPSQVLFALLGALVESGKEVGFISDLLTGDAQAQNAPATSVLALIEQGTRAFKPMVQKFFYSAKGEYEKWFHQNFIHADELQEHYTNFLNDPNVSMREDFNEDSLDIVPVADPTMSSEAHKYAKTQALLQTIDRVPNPLAILQIYYKDLQVPDTVIQAILTPQQPPGPSIDELKLKQQEQFKQMDMVAKQAQEVGREKDRELKAKQVAIDEIEKRAKMIKLSADAEHDEKQIELEKARIQTEREKVEVNREQVDVLRDQVRVQAQQARTKNRE